MASMKVTALLSKCVPAGASVARSAWSPRIYFTASKPLQKNQSDSMSPEDIEKITEAAKAVKEGAIEVKKAGEFFKENTSSEANSVTNMTKDMTDSVTGAAEKVTGAPEGTVKAALEAAKVVSSKIKEKVGE